jgi:DNA-binding CsgD family transcriptional regulator/PAS domain-containing protein
MTRSGQAPQLRLTSSVPRSEAPRGRQEFAAHLATQCGLAESAARSPNQTPDVHSFSVLCSLLHEGATLATGWHSFLARLTEQVAARSAILSLHGALAREALFLQRYDVGSHIECATSDLPADASESPQRDGRVWVAQDLRSRVLGVDLHRDGQLNARLRLVRLRSTLDFTANERDYLQLLVPHLRAAIETRAKLDEVTLELAHYSSAMDKLAMGALIMNRHGRVLHVSRAARAILDQRKGIFLADDRIEFRDREDSMRLKQMICRALEADPSDASVIGAARIQLCPDKPDLRLIVQPVYEMVRDSLRSPRGVAIFMSIDDNKSDDSDVPPGIVQRLFCLTPKEAALALKLSGGLSLQEAAQTLQISPNTARAHLRSIFSKTGIDRQTKLVRAILRSVAMLGG